MNTAIDRPSPTREFAKLDDFIPADGSAYIFGTVGEERSFHDPAWENRAGNVKFMPISRQEYSQIEVYTQAGLSSVSLRSGSALRGLLSYMGTDLVYLDITGLTHSTWAPLIRAWIKTECDLRIVYREPHQYNYVESPSEGRLFELSDDFGGLKPLPGFASLVRSSSPTCFVPLLGFEGPRHARLLEDLESSGLIIVPVVGIPGFRVEYPYHAFLGNKSALNQGHSIAYTRFAAANSPFDTLFLLEDIEREHPDFAMKLGLVGTKPHALGAVLYALRSTRPVELLHDHPIRSAKRTSGMDRVLVYHISSLEF